MILDKIFGAGKDANSKPEMENVEREKQEYKLIAKYLRRKGLKMYAYDSVRDKLIEVQTSTKDNVHLIAGDDGKLAPVDLGLEEATVNSAHTHFEALNMVNAEKRLAKYKAGKIKDLCNLRIPNPDGIKLFQS